MKVSIAVQDGRSLRVTLSHTSDRSDEVPIEPCLSSCADRVKYLDLVDDRISPLPEMLSLAEDIICACFHSSLLRRGPMIGTGTCFSPLLLFP